MPISVQKVLCIIIEEWLVFWNASSFLTEKSLKNFYSSGCMNLWMDSDLSCWRQVLRTYIAFLQWLMSPSLLTCWINILSWSYGLPGLVMQISLIVEEKGHGEHSLFPLSYEILMALHLQILHKHIFKKWVEINSDKVQCCTSRRQKNKQDKTEWNNTTLN